MSYSRSKLTKYMLLTRSRSLISSLPSTRNMSKNNFWSLMARYSAVIVKPSRGFGGVGVMSISSKGNNRYLIHYGRFKKIITGRHATYSFLNSKMRRSVHIVQRKIHLARVKGKPFDVRVMVQRRKGYRWLVTGKLAKIAGYGHIITNIARSKGRVVRLSTAIKSSNIQGKYVSRINRRVNNISITTVKQLQRYYRINSVGVDIGIDPRGKVWIIEANFKPDRTLFLKLKDKSMYRRMMGHYKK